MAGAGGLPFIALPRIVGRARDALEAGETDAIVYLRGAITWESALKLKKEIEIFVEAGVQSIDLMISSGGGSADAALMLVDLIDSLKGPGGVFVRTIVDGVAASAATLVSVAGHQRWIHKRGWLMLHLPSIATSGPFRANSADLAVTHANVENLVGQMKQVYHDNMYFKTGENSGGSRPTTVSEEERAWLEKELERDNYILSQECVTRKLVDHVGLPERKRLEHRPRKASQEAAERELASLLILGLENARNAKYNSKP